MTVTKMINGKAEYMNIDEADAGYFGFNGWKPVQKTEAHVAVKKEKEAVKADEE